MALTEAILLRSSRHNGPSDLTRKWYAVDPGSRSGRCVSNKVGCLRKWDNTLYWELYELQIYIFSFGRSGTKTDIVKSLLIFVFWNTNFVLTFLFDLDKQRLLSKRAAKSWFMYCIVLWLVATKRRKLLQLLELLYIPIPHLFIY